MPQLIATVEGVEIKRVQLIKDRTTLGRKPHNDIVLENMVVSSEHCAFDLLGLADVFVEDLRSTNGTYVNGMMIKQRHKLHNHDQIAIGNFRIEYLSESGHTGFGETMAMKIDSHSGLTPLGNGSGAGAPQHASFKVLTGSSAGLEVPVVKAVTTFGKPGVAVVAVSHRRTGYFVAHLDGEQHAMLNGEPLSADARPLAHDDVLELAGTKMLFVLG
ncbi:MAG: FHA domain-containing protein [Burkholderiaceae bacterium]|nr:FHA domain-containing protein [Burkholderiaceae bacterium]